jgi:hypothetical protein
MGFMVVPVLGNCLTFVCDILHTRPAVCQTCRNGKCQSEDYKCVECYNGHLTYECRCGIRYIAKRDCFLELLADGTMKPYMKKDAAGNWQLE